MNPKELEASFCLYSDEGISEEAVDEIMDAFVEACVKHGVTGGGGIGPPPPEEKICPECGGVGIKDDEEEEVEPTSEEDWTDLYGNDKDSAPVAQRTEQRSPTPKVEGSIPSGGANVREHREDDRETGGQDSSGHCERHREWSKDPGRDHSGEDG